MSYLQVSFDQLTPLYGIIVRGHPKLDQYVTSFKCLYSYDGSSFHYLLDDTNTLQIFRGPIDARTPVENLFKVPIEAKVIRIYSLTYHKSIAMRVELLGCSLSSAVTTTTAPPLTVHSETIVVPVCNDPMGVENGLLQSGQVRVSSIKSSYSIKNPQFKLESIKLSSPKGWIPSLNTPNEFIVFDFLDTRHLTGIKMKGGEYGWVVAYLVHFSHDNLFWNEVMDLSGKTKLFLANFDSESVKSNHFDFPINARYLKIVPTKWHETIELKVEPIGCFKPYRKYFYHKPFCWILNNSKKITHFSNTNCTFRIIY